ncbi:RNA polymerase II transcription factor B subunit 1 [Ceratobasidium sp. 428]|nr:RNA polymerase II transcription factor B subunit 1 [Ceratobasidium sp. 428]
MSGAVVRARAKATFQKRPGYLVLSQRSLSWTEEKQKEPRLNLPNTSLQKMFFSKPGSAVVSMRVTDGPDPKLNAYTFVFSSSKAVADGQNFKELITNILAQNVAQQQAAARAEAAAAEAQAATPVQITPRADRPLSSNDLRKFVLLKRTDLAALHRELVMTGNITESEFWAGREHLLSAEESVERQRKGRPTQMLELRATTTNERGDIKITITPERAQQIFIEFPVVKRAYDENVPDPLSPSEFWTRYLSSKLFDRNRASSRSAAAQHTTKDDPIFDKYLQKEDDGDEPLHQRTPGSSLTNLHATSEDHEETGNAKDFTMKAGGLRSTLPLIRKFNEHSTNVLDAGLTQPSAKRRRTELADVEYFARLDMEDLRDNIPEDLTQAMANLQAATSEFLRQFWAAAYDNKDTSQERAAKMISYLSNTHSKIAPMMTSARNQGCDPQLVRDAFMPTLDAVNKALAIYKSRDAAR